MANDLLYKLRPARWPHIARRGLGMIIPPRLASYRQYRALFTGRTGLELGGPSAFFEARGLFPAYSEAARIDNCNFGRETLWEGSIGERPDFHYNPGRAPGKQYISEATALGFAPDVSYDFLLSSHMLEHSANPLRALHEWSRVLKPNGTLLLVLPHKEGTFDHQRPVTPLEHLVQDFEGGTGEDDLTHLPEILALHDLHMDVGVASLQEFEARSARNYENRALHQHVFDTRAAVELVDHARFQIRAAEAARPMHIAILATRLAAGAIPDNRRFLSDVAVYRRTSPFRSDRLGRR
jgi:SAM-dependent methyltransferase